MIHLHKQVCLKYTGIWCPVQIQKTRESGVQAPETDLNV